MIAGPFRARPVATRLALLLLAPACVGHPVGSARTQASFEAKAGTDGVGGGERWGRGRSSR